jgi:hypothetical protein
VKKTLLDFFDEIHDFTEQVEKGDGVVISFPSFQWIHPERDGLPVKGRKRGRLWSRNSLRWGSRLRSISGFEADIEPFVDLSLVFRADD